MRSKCSTDDPIEVALGQPAGLMACLLLSKHCPHAADMAVSVSCLCCTLPKYPLDKYGSGVSCEVTVLVRRYISTVR